MLKKLKDIDVFTRNVVFVFVGTSLLNFANLFYQLLIAHSITPKDFAAFNTLIAIYMLIATPLTNLQIALAKYGAEFNAGRETEKLRSLFSFFLKWTLALAVFTFFSFSLFSSPMMSALKIPFISSAYILALLSASAWVLPVFLAILQGLELFGWLIVITMLAAGLKLLLTFIFLKMGMSVSGALLAFFISVAVEIFVCAWLLKRFFTFKNTSSAGVNFKKVLAYLLPVALNSLCFTALVSSDMIMVKLYFSEEQAGFYSLAQMVGKIFLFLPAAISVVLLPRASGLRAQNSDTLPTLKSSLIYGAGLCFIAVAGYNLFPELVLKLLTGKAPADSVLLGRLFSFSMTFFTLFLILATYFISIEDLRFLKYLAAFTFLQLLGIVLFHASLFQVQGILCVNSILLFSVSLALIRRKKGREGIVCAT